MEFGDFACDAGWAVPQDFLGIGDALCNAVGRFVENHGALFDTQMLEHAATLAAALWKEAYEEELLVGESGGGKRGQHGARARDGHDWNFVPHAKRDQAVARVGDEWHARIADQGNFG